MGPVLVGMEAVVTSTAVEESDAAGEDERGHGAAMDVAVIQKKGAELAVDDPSWTNK